MVVIWFCTGGFVMYLVMCGCEWWYFGGCSLLYGFSFVFMVFGGGLVVGGGCNVMMFGGCLVVSGGCFVLYGGLVVCFCGVCIFMVVLCGGVVVWLWFWGIDFVSNSFILGSVRIFALHLPSPSCIELVASWSKSSVVSVSSTLLLT